MRRGILRARFVVALALVSACGDNLGSLPAPANVMASDGTSVEVVSVTWSSVPGATSYRVYRDGAAIADVIQPALDDADASAGLMSAPVLTASAGIYVDQVLLSWTPFSSAQGTAHTYTVTALKHDVESDPSIGDVGYRGAETLVGYEISKDGGSSFATPLPATTLTYSDANAPGGVITPGVVTATDGALTTHIAVSLAGTSVVPGANVRYVVRAVTVDGSIASNEAIGYRTVGTPKKQWYRHELGYLEEDTRSVLTGETSTSFVDATTPAGRAYAYDCTLTAAGADPATTKPELGWRAPSSLEKPRADTMVIDRMNDATTATVADDTVYVGGGFYYAGPPTGSFAALDATTGVPSPPFLGVYTPFDLDNNITKSGVVVAVPDGSGGWYLGGDFVAVQGVPQARLAHLNATGSLDRSFAPVINDGAVSAIARIGNKVYVGGWFRTADWEARTGFAVFDATTGALDPYTLALDNPDDERSGARQLFVDGGRLLIAGSFASVDGVPRNGLAAIELATQTLTSWDPAADAPLVGIGAFVGGTLFVLGDFTQIGGEARDGLAAIDASTGQATAFAPGSPGTGRVWKLTSDGTTVFIEGTFTTFAGQARNGLAALDASSGALLPFQTEGPDTFYTFTFTALALRGNTLYVGGHFHAIGNNAREGLAAFDATTGTLLPWAPAVTSENFISSLTVLGDKIYVGGDMNSVGGKLLARSDLWLSSSLAAFDRTTGALLDWDPGVRGRINAMAVSGNSLFITGDLTLDNYETREHFIRLDRTTGAKLPWTDLGEFANLVVVGNLLYVAGNSYLRAIDLTTGSLTGWDPAPNGTVSTVVVDGGTVYAGGTFTSIGGQSRNNLAAIDATTAQATSWNPAPSGAVNDMATAGGTLYVAGAFSTIDGASRSHLAAFDLSDGTLTPWAPVAPVSTSVVAVAGDVFVPGAAFDATTGNALVWNPWRLGDFSPVAADGASLICVGRFDHVAGWPRNGIVIFDP